MMFNKDRIYTALNADELKVGSVVIGSNNIANLELLVRSDIVTKLLRVEDENKEHRFITERGEYSFAYLVEEPEEEYLKWTALKIGDVVRSCEGVISMVIGIDPNSEDSHICIASGWVKDNNLKFYELVKE